MKQHYEQSLSSFCSCASLNNVQRFWILVRISLLTWSCSVMCVLFLTCSLGAPIFSALLGEAPLQRIEPASKGIYFYIHREPQWLVREQLSIISLTIPGAPVYISSDAGDDYTALCTEYSNYAKRSSSVLSDKSELCHFSWEPHNMHNAASLGTWTKEGRAHEWCEAWTQRVERGLLWLNSTWTVYHEGDNLILNHPLEVDSRADVFVMGNQRCRLPEDISRQAELRCGHSSSRFLSHPGGLMFRSASWLTARSAIMLNRSLWNISEPCTDTCTAAMFQASCAVEVPSPGFMQLGSQHWMAMGKPDSWSQWFRHYRTWPHGIDLSECLTCLRLCQQAHCSSEEPNGLGNGVASGVVRCVARSHCPCPSILHSVHRGLCGGRGTIRKQEGEGFAAMEDNDWDAYFLRKDKAKLLVCLTRGLCAPAASSLFRVTSAIVHGVVIFVTTVSLCLGMQHCRRVVVHTD